MLLKFEELFPQVEATAAGLSKINSVTPPSDTRAIVRYANSLLQPLSGVDIKILSEVDSTPNLVARVKGRRPGKRLLLNGHLDTFEIVAPERWRHPPLGGEVIGRRLYGVGVSDMKAGCASLLSTFIFMAQHRDLWNGELTLSLVGWEEAGGKHGTDFLLRSMEDLKSVDVCLIADVGSTRVIRFAEKGRYRFKLEARGIPGHGAHVHKTKNAIDMLIDAIVDYKTQIAHIRPDCPKDVLSAIHEASRISESVSGPGETNVLLSVTNNIGVFKAGSAPNLVPGYAEAIMDTRLPVGVSPGVIKTVLDDLCKRRSGLSYETLMTCDSLYSDPHHLFLEILKRNAAEAFGEPCVATVRVGGTDAKHLRRFGIPCYSCGVEGGNMGAPDEYVDFDELDRVFQTHLYSCLEFLSSH